MPHRQQHGPARAVRLDVGAGVAELLADADRPGAWMLLVDGVPQSHVDLDDPAYLDFEYMRRIGHLIDLADSGDQPLRILHLGGGALTLARYTMATRPGARQLVIESNAELAGLVSRELPLPRASRGSGVRVRIADARQAAEQLYAGTFDLVIADLFTGFRTATRLTSVEFVTALARLLTPTGVYVANVGDGSPLAHARARAATARAVFPQVAMIADPAVLHGRRPGNLVMAGSRHQLPVADLIRRLAADPMPGRLLQGQDLTRFIAGARPMTDSQPGPEAADAAGEFGAAG
jgi:spermidine synthase